MGQYTTAMTFMQRFKLNQSARRAKALMESGNNQSYVPKAIREKEKEQRKPRKKKTL